MEVMCISALLLHSPAIARWRKPSVDTPKCKCFGIKLTDKADKSTDKFFVEVFQSTKLHASRTAVSY